MKKYSEGITLYEQYKDLCDGDAELKSRASHLYTNRGLTWHQLDNQDAVIKDCTYVLSFLDETNTKSLFRRSHSYKVKERYHEAVQDLVKLLELDPNNTLAKKELDSLQLKLNEK